jgi:hypothetical protein
VQRAANAIESACALLHWTMPHKRLLGRAESGKRRQPHHQNAPPKVDTAKKAKP